MRKYGRRRSRPYLHLEQRNCVRDQRYKQYNRQPGGGPARNLRDSRSFRKSTAIAVGKYIKKLTTEGTEKDIILSVFSFNDFENTEDSSVHSVVSLLINLSVYSVVSVMHFLVQSLTLSYRLF